MVDGTKRFILGVDPGASGAACLYDVKNARPQTFLDCSKDPDGLIDEFYLDHLRQLCVRHPNLRVVIEKVWARPGQSALTTWAQASVYAQTCLWLRTWSQQPIEYVAPVTWKTALKLTGEDGQSPAERKKLTLQWARTRWPHEAGLRLEKHQDRADAAAIAYWFSKFGGSR